LVERPSDVIDHQLCLLQIDFISSEGKAHAFVIDEGFSEGLSATRVFGGDVMSSLRSTPPTHAVGKTRWCETHLSVFETLVRRAEHHFFGYTNVFERQHTMSTWHGVIDGVHHAFEHDARIR